MDVLKNPYTQLLAPNQSTKRVQIPNQNDVLGPLELDRCAFFASIISYLLFTVWPCALIEYRHHDIKDNSSSIPTSMSSADLLTFNLCFCEKLMIAFFFPSNIIVPVFLLQSSCAMHDTSTHHLITPRSSMLSVNFVCIMPFKYFISK